MPIRADYPKFTDKTRVNTDKTRAKTDKTRAKTGKTRANTGNPYPNMDNLSTADPDQRKRNPKPNMG